MPPHWTQKEVDRLQTLAAAGHSNEEIAAALNRSLSAVKVKRSHLKIKRPQDTRLRVHLHQDIKDLLASQAEEHDLTIAGLITCLALAAQERPELVEIGKEIAGKRGYKI